MDFTSWMLLVACLGGTIENSAAADLAPHRLAGAGRPVPPTGGIIFHRVAYQSGRSSARFKALDRARCP